MESSRLTPAPPAFPTNDKTNWLSKTFYFIPRMNMFGEKKSVQNPFEGIEIPFEFHVEAHYIWCQSIQLFLRKVRMTNKHNNFNKVLFRKQKHSIHIFWFISVNGNVHTSAT